MQSLIVYCPECKIPIQLSPINCQIIRCGGYWMNGNFIQFPQHASKQIITSLKKNKHVGCGIPLQYIQDKLVKVSWRT